MELPENDAIVPASVTHEILLDVGPSMEQSVPEDYALASLLLRTLQTRDANEFEFLMKTYLPIVIEPGGVGQLALVERIGISAVSFTPVTQFQMEDIDVSNITGPDDLLLIMNRLVEELSQVERKRSTTVLGLLHGQMAKGVVATLSLPTMESMEAYAVELPPVLDNEESEPLSQLLSTVYDVHRSGELVQLLSQFEGAVQATLERPGQAETPKVQRLKARIEHLQREISTIQSRIEAIDRDLDSRQEELRRMLKNRQSALERDQKRLADLTERNRGVAKALKRAFEKLRDSVDRVTGIYQDVEQRVSEILVDSEDVPTVEGPLSLLLPFYLLGFSKKGVLQVSVVPPLHYRETGQKVGIMRDFVDTLNPMNEGLVELASRLEKAIDRNPSLVQQIRVFSRSKNLLALDTTRNMIREGGSLLVAEGVARESIIHKLDELLKAIPSKKIELKDRQTLILPDDGTGTKVTFHVSDEAGTPIERAQLHIADLRVTSDSMGRAVVRLPQSSYSVQVMARGFRSKSIDFSIDREGALSIPIKLTALTREERLEAALGELEARAGDIERIRKRLRDVFQKQGETITSIPAHRDALVELLTELGYNPEAWIAEARTRKGMVKRLLERDDRRDALRRDVLRVAEESQESGGVMLLSQVLMRMDRLGWDANSEEIESVIKELGDDGLIEGISVLESGAKIVNFVPVELTDDPQAIISLASKRAGMLTIEDIVSSLGWTEARVRNALDLLVQNGVAKQQRSFSKSTRYWFPGFREKR
ncbi:hypothetical protein EU538_10060 [Candidatus Thorarchaeota archaeon]|nr:MAG: hypothetical protein EU538_10060 [Candidatus Thorarchaeota archaeon]